MSKITRHAMKWRQIGQPFPKRVKAVTSFIFERMISIIKVIKGSLNYI